MFNVHVPGIHVALEKYDLFRAVLHIRPGMTTADKHRGETGVIISLL